MSTTLTDPRLSDEQRAALASAASDEPLGSVELEVFEANDRYPIAKLDEAVKNFATAGHVPTLVIGHPTLDKDGIPDPVADDRPAWGLGSALKRIGTKLVATFEKVPQSIRKAIEAGRFHNLSSELYQNVKGAGAVLRRVALLGAQPPAVTGLNASGPVWRFAEPEPAFDVLTYHAEEAPMDAEPAAKPNPLASLVLAKATAIAAETEGETSETVLTKVAEQLGMPATEFVAWLSGQSEVEMDADKIARLAAALNVPVEEIQAAMGESPAEEEEPAMDANAEKSKPKPATEVITFAEHKVALDTIATLKATNERATAELKQRVDALQHNLRGKDIDTFCEDLRRDTGLAGALLTEVRTYLRKHDGVDAFAESDERDPKVAAQTLFRKLAEWGKKDGAKNVSADAVGAVDAFAELDAAKVEYERHPLKGGMTLKNFARAKGIDVDAFSEWETARKAGK